MAYKFKKALALALVAATTFSYVTPNSQLFVPASISLAAADTKITVDPTLSQSESIAINTTITLNMPTATTETYEGLVENITYKVRSSSDVLKLMVDSHDVNGNETDYNPASNKTLQFQGVKGGTSTLTITKYAGSKIVGIQTSEVSVISKSNLSVTASGSIDTGAVNAGQTIKVYKGEAFKIDAKTDTAPAQISGVTDFSTTVGSSTIVSYVTEDKDNVGSITATSVKKPELKESTYSVYFVANATGTTNVTIKQAAAKDKSTSENTFTFKVEVVARDGELSATYDYDRDGKSVTYKADTYDNVRFTTKTAPDSVALDLTKNKTIYLNARSGSNQAISYSSSDTGIATVSNNGQVTAVGEGSADITISTAASNASGIKASEIRVRINVTKNEVAFITLTGAVNASSIGTYDGSRVPDINVGKELQNDSEAYESIKNDDKTVILSTKDKSTANINITSNANNYLDVTSSDTGIVTYTNGRINAIRPGHATITFETKDGAPVASTSKIVVNVYVTELFATNSIRTGNAISVNPVKNSASIGASSTYGELKYDTKVYTYDEKEDKYTEDTKSGVTIDARGNVSYQTKGSSGTVYAKLYVENSKDALGVKDTYVPIAYAATAENKITLTGIANDAANIL
nr:Ig-like domain-containing protein [Lachnospiraceae bacterium]